jgi:uncharacterized protein (DUF983 family)
MKKCKLFLFHIRVCEDLELPAKLTGKKRKEFVYDEEWLKKVLNNICPDCDGKLEKKGILITCTTNQHLDIYGSPILVAYTTKEKKEPITENLCQGRICPECHGTIFDHNTKTDETNCHQCGLILKGPPCYGVKYPWHISFSDVIPLNTI